jgi:23S rRNA (adenine2503-C2)-methyltransferase
MEAIRKSFYQLNFEELQILLIKLDFNPALAKDLFDYKYKFKELNSKSTPPSFLEIVSNIIDFSLPKITKTQTSTDGTIKFLFELEDQKNVECVLIPFFKKYTICLSSQVGCAMNCSFCYTGTQGLKRHLKFYEIIQLYMSAFQYLKTNINKFAPTPNIVFMGQGEPLHNFDEVKHSIERFLDKRAFYLGSRQITLSTAGYLPGLMRFNELQNINLAISFHSAKNETRNELIPLNKKYPIELLLSTLSNLTFLKKQFITFEYLLIKNLNDSKEDAELLANTLKDRKAIVNLIPFNPFPGSHFERPTNLEVLQFKDWLVAHGVRTMVRTTKGDEILAACGQLNTKLVNSDLLE